MPRNFVKTIAFVTLAFSMYAQAQMQLQQPELLVMKLRDQQYPVVELKEGKREKDLDKAKAGAYRDLTDEEREAKRLVIKNGIVFDRTGSIVEETKNDAVGHKDKINYVMDPHGNFYLFDEYKFPEIRHSSIFAGKPVAGAGEISIKGGHIVYIDSDSGHYSSSRLMPYVQQELQNDGVDLRSVDVEKN